MGKMVKAMAVAAALLALSMGGAAIVGHGRLERYGGQAFSDDKKAPAVRVEIPKGTNARQISSILEKSGVIRSARQFYWYARIIANADQKLRPGEYDLNPTLTPAVIIQKLVKGDVVTYRFTIPEGSNLKDIARIVGQSGLADEQETLKLCHDAAFARALGVPDKQDTLEGYLFPDTYRFPSGVSAKDILKHMNARLKQVLSDDIIAKGAKAKLEPHEILTLASIVEKETGAPQERPQISAVFHNRLKKGMKLQTDPTVIYGIPDYDGNITKKHLEMPHPYNTYVIKALPPGPIASPGASAILAAVEPADVKYLFFVSQNNGTHVFCETLRCHEENVKKWQVQFFRKGKGD